MLDLLTLDRNGRLTVIELKADEDLHLPLQALDYWIRVRALNADRQPVVGMRADGCFRRLSGRGILAGRRFAELRRDCCWWVRRCGFIRRMSRCCGIFRRRWSGS